MPAKQKDESRDIGKRVYKHIHGLQKETMKINVCERAQERGREREREFTEE